MSAPAFDSRVAKGEAIAKVESNVRRIDQNEYRVKSQSGRGEYVVLSTELGWNCSCPDYAFRQLKCKHVIAVELSLQIRRRIENSRRIVPLDYQSCLVCGSEKIVRHGVLHNKSGDLQRYSCKNCGKRFTLNLGFERMRVTPQAITSAMQLYFSGESLRNVQKALRLLGIDVSHVSVYRWITKYVRLMGDYLDGLEPEVGDTWRADELYVKVKGNMKYLFALMDDETRFWIAQQVSDAKGTSDVQPLLRESKEIAHKIPKTFITDGAKNFHHAYRREFQHWRGSQRRPVHIREIQLEGIVHNNKMERLNGEVRDREKVMRGLKRADSPILKGYQIYHNFVRPHEALNGDTPADRAGIKVEGRNKWMTLIQNASHVQEGEG